MNNTDLAYRKTAATGAVGVGLLIALYDTLAGNLRRAAEAQLSNDIDKRCREANHALTVISHLENWLTHGTGGELSSRLAAFYIKLRHDLLDAQVQQSASLLEAQMHEVLRVRAIWQQFDEAASKEPTVMPAARVYQPPADTAQPHRTENSWSA